MARKMLSEHQMQRKTNLVEEEHVLVYKTKSCWIGFRFISSSEGLHEIKGVTTIEEKGRTTKAPQFPPAKLWL